MGTRARPIVYGAEVTDVRPLTPQIPYNPARRFLLFQVPAAPGAGWLGVRVVGDAGPVNVGPILPPGTIIIMGAADRPESAWSFVNVPNGTGFVDVDIQVREQ